MKKIRNFNKFFNENGVFRLWFDFDIEKYEDTCFFLKYKNFPKFQTLEKLFNYF